MDPQRTSRTTEQMKFDDKTPQAQMDEIELNAAIAELEIRARVEELNTIAAEEVERYRQTSHPIERTCQEATRTLKAKIVEVAAAMKALLVPSEFWLKVAHDNDRVREFFRLVSYILSI